jgi:hypothetical protein
MLKAYPVNHLQMSNATGYKHIYRRVSGLVVVIIKRNRTRIYYKSFKDFNEAIKARDEFLFFFHANKDLYT